MTTAPLAIDKVLTDPRLLGAGLGDIATWATWLVVLKAAFGHPLTDEELQVFKAVAGGRSLPLKRVRELWVIAGRRGGKSRMAAALAVYFALFVKHRLAGGERGMVLVLAATIDQAQIVFGYTLAFLNNSPVLQREIASTTRSEIRLKNGIVIAIHANSFRSVRGRTLCAAIFDEVAYWRDDQTATPDTETYSAVLPALLTTNGMLCGISSPYRKTGLIHAKHKQFYGTDSDDTLVVQGPTLLFNKTLDPAAIAAQAQADPTAARSEWEALFREDLASFLDDILIDGAVDCGRPLELPPQPGVYYRAFVDASGGAVGGDAYAIAIAHREDGRYVLDVVRGRSGPFEPVELTKEYAELCKQYRVTSVTGDKYAMEWVQSAWRNTGVAYVASERTASELYIEALPLFTRALVALPDHPVLLRELRLLERSPARLKREQVSHPRGCHDDFANVTCGVLCGLASYLGAGAYQDALWRAGDDDVPDSVLDWQEQERQRRHAELMARYFGPVSLNPIPREYVEAAKKKVTG
jgi:Terminase large subunit, ATPase domain